MLLLGIKENNGWLQSQWNLTYKTGWNGICKAIFAIYDFHKDPEILKTDIMSVKNVEINNKKDILKIEESNALILRGFSTILKTPMQITFFNQTKTVNVEIPKTTEGEFSEADYEKFNKSLSQYMDSIEIMMHVELEKK